MRRVGVEEEFLLVDPESGEVVGLATDVLADAAYLADRFVRAQPSNSDVVPTAELKQEQAEIASAPAAQLSELRRDLVSRRRLLNAAAGRSDATIAAAGTSPLPARSATMPAARYQRMTAEFGILARRELTCGTHVHVSVASRAEGVAVIDRIRPWLHLLTALTANSPYWDGEDTGYASWRTLVWGQWPTAGPQELFRSEAGYDAAVQALLASHTMLDSGMVYFDARLSEHFPTVEIRVADACTDVDDSVLLAAVCRGLVETAARQASAGAPPHEIRVSTMRSATWRAARSGMAGELVYLRRGRACGAWTLVEDVLAEIEDALDTYGDRDLVAGHLERLRRHGTGAERQRAAAGPTDDLRAVVCDIARRTNSG
jgi:carboxylate-amine ligase